MYIIVNDVDDTNGQAQTMEAVMSFFKEVQQIGYIWVSQSALEMYLSDEKLHKHMVYILRLMADRRMMVGVEVRRQSDNKKLLLWRLFGTHCPQYNSRSIPDSDVLE